MRMLRIKTKGIKMKKLFLFIAVITTLSFGQSWNTIVTTTLSEPNVDKTDLFTNKDGNHLLIKRYNGNIVYYNLNTAGEVDATKTITLETAGDFPNIVGSEDKIIALYKVGNLIKGKYSTNGTSWTDLPYNITTTANECNGIDAIYDLERGVHVVWATRDNGSNFETYYQRLNPSNLQWVDGYPVTNYGNEVGGQPSVAFSDNRVHVSYNTNYFSQPISGSVKSRDKYYSTWQNPQSVVTGSDQSAFEKLVARGDSLFIVFSKFINGVPITWDLYSKKRSISGSTWSSSTILENSVDASVFGFNKTSNSNLHTVYKPGGLLHKYYNGLIWSDAQQINETPENAFSLGFTSQSNDLYTMWKDGNSNYLKYRHYDAAPLAPANYAVSTYQSGTNYYPRLSWSLNNEPDVRLKTSGAYKIERRTRTLNASWSNWTTLGNLSGTTSSYIDYSISNASGGDKEAEYRITAIDIGNNSSPTQSVTIVYGQGVLDKTKINGMVSVYSLDQNYPNPFNPGTMISYSIKEEGFVTLKIYDILGKEIVTLVNENKPAGIYETEFNASQLPSGLYIYKLQSGTFTDVKKMLLAK